MTTVSRKVHALRKRILPVEKGREKIPLNQKLKPRAGLGIAMGENTSTDTPLMRFGVQLRLKRNSVGYRPLDFASKIGLDIETLAAIEFGLASLTEIDVNLPRIADGLGISSIALRNFLDYLYNERESDREQ